MRGVRVRCIAIRIALRRLGGSAEAALNGLGRGAQISCLHESHRILHRTVHVAHHLDSFFQ